MSQHPVSIASNNKRHIPQVHYTPREIQIIDEFLLMNATVKVTYNEPFRLYVVKDRLWYVTFSLRVISQPIAVRHAVQCGSGSFIALSDSGCVPNPFYGVSTVLLHAESWSVEF